MLSPKPESSGCKGKKSNAAGGSAASGGINFQAAVTAYAAVHIANGSCLKWLDGVVEDLPVELVAESGGPGDDVRVSFNNGEVAEVQVKKGLKKNNYLWDSLIALARGIDNKDVSYGVLIVCPESSLIIRRDLAAGIVNMGDGHEANLKGIVKEWRNKLIESNLPISVCERIRVTTLHCLYNDSASINEARFVLAQICADKSQTAHAWERIYRDASFLIQLRGRRTIETVFRVLKSAGILIGEDPRAATPISNLSALAKWTVKSTEYFNIYGVEAPLLFDKAWIPVKTVISEDDCDKAKELAEAVANYHAWNERDNSYDDKEVDPLTLGRFIKHSVVVAGPGLGKTTLLRRLQRTYASEGLPAVLIRLPALVARIRNIGCTFEEGVIALGLDGSGVDSERFNCYLLNNGIFLFDGLDEVGVAQESISRDILKFSHGYKRSRLIITTRPIGYDTSLLREWRHYEILPLKDSSIEWDLLTIIGSIVEPESDEFKEIQKLVSAQLKENKFAKVLLRSPLLLGFAVVLATKRMDFGNSKTEFYRRLFKLVDTTKNERVEIATVTRATLIRFRDIIAWDLLQHPCDIINETLARCAQKLSVDLHISPFAAREKCEESLLHWEKVGLIERLNHATDQTIAFIHKTIGEYAASLYFTSLPPSEQNQEFLLFLKSEIAFETLAFVASLDSSDFVPRQLVRHFSHVAQKDKIILLLVSLIKRNRQYLDEQLIRSVLDISFNQIAGQDRKNALEVTKSLLELCSIYPVEIAEKAKLLLNHALPWTRISGWALLLNSVGNCDNYSDLDSVIQEHMGFIGGFRSSPIGVTISLDCSSELFEHFTRLSLQTLTNAGHTEKVSSLLIKLFHYRKTMSFSFLRLIADTMKNYGFKEQIAEIEEILNRTYKPFYFESEEYRSAENIAGRNIALSINMVNEVGEHQVAADGCAETRRLLQLNALLNVAGYEEREPADFRYWQSLDATAPVQEVFKGLIYVAGIDAAELRKDVDYILHIFEKDEAREYFSVLFEHRLRIDIEPQWELASKVNLQITMLESALYHGSNWIVKSAFYLLTIKLNDNELFDISKKVLSDARGTALWYAAQVLINVKPKEGTAILIRRLQTNLVSGCRYLYKLLNKVNTGDEKGILVVITNSLLSSCPETASEAIKLVDKFNLKDAAEIVPLLHRSFEYWKKYEKPIPDKEVKVIPNSPRAAILSLIISIEEQHKYDIYELLNDSRNDVVEVATKSLFSQLNLSDENREVFLNDIKSQKIDCKLLNDAIHRSVPFSKNQLELIRQLFDHDDYRIRYCAMAILSKEHSTVNEIAFWKEKLTNDPHPDIRERAAGLGF